MITRRNFLKVLGAAATIGVSLGGYAFAIEPMRLRVQRNAVKPPNWPDGLNLRIAALADIHACEPWMSAERITYIVDQTNRLDPDLVVLLGDYAAGHPWVTKGVDTRDWSSALAALKAPLGVHAILGNHDWWDDSEAQRRGHGPVIARTALEGAGIPVYENDAVRLEKAGQAFWLAGLGDQIALLPKRKFGRRRWRGVDDLPLTLSKVTDGAPVILLAHEPDVFPRVPQRVSLTLSGHTHGGQVRLLGYSPVVPSDYGNKFAYGHIVEGAVGVERHMIVSGGLGCSILPVRLGMPPEVNLIEVGHAAGEMHGQS